MFDVKCERSSRLLGVELNFSPARYYSYSAGLVLHMTVEIPGIRSLPIANSGGHCIRGECASMMQRNMPDSI
jgi:hypothetical protein